MIELDNHTNLDIDIDALDEIQSYLCNHKNIELIVVENDEMQELNYQFRKINKATDVLSFPLSTEIPDTLLGCIVISIDFATLNAREFNHTFDDEFALLFIHGLLHLLGFNHEIDNGEQRAKEEELIKKFNLPTSLIVRNS